MHSHYGLVRIMSDDPTCPVGMVRVQYWGGQVDGKEEVIYPEKLTPQRIVLTPSDGLMTYTLYATEIDRIEVDEYHRPIYAVYVAEGLEGMDDIWWLGPWREEGEGEEDE